jgi:hypothetical protein
MQGAAATPFDTHWNQGGGGTPLTIQDLFCGGAISIPTAPTNLIINVYRVLLILQQGTRPSWRWNCN